MAVGPQTFARPFGNVDIRQYAFTRDNWMRNNSNVVFAASPAAMIFLAKPLNDFQSKNFSGSGKVVDSGGVALVDTVTLGEHDGGGTMAGPWGVHNVDPDDNTRILEANWKFYQHGLAVNAHELQINSGDFRRSVSFVEAQTKNVLRTLVKREVTDIYSTAGAAEAITGLDSLIGTGTVQGISTTIASTYFSRGLSARGTAIGSVSFASASFAAQGLEDMRTAYNNASEGPGAEPNVILTDYDTYERYEGRLQPLSRFDAPVGTGDGAFRALSFHGKPVLPDSYCTSGVMYFVNTTEDGIRMHALANFDNDFAPFKEAERQRAMVSPLGFTGNLFVNDRRLSNKMTGIVD